MIKRIIISTAIVTAAAFAVSYGYVYEAVSKLRELPSVRNGGNSNVTIKKEYTSPISIDYLRSLNFEGSDLVIEQTLAPGSNYKRYLASYQSEGNKIYGLLTVPNADQPENGFPAIIFNHGYIPPRQYVTTEKYVAYVDNLARNGFVVFKIDLRGHGNSEGHSSGTYFSSSYTIDVLNAIESLQKYEAVNPDRIGIWGHSMSGNLVLRTMLVTDQIKAGVIWAGAVYSYQDFAKYGINDNSFVRTPTPTPTGFVDKNRDTSQHVQELRQRGKEVNFTIPFWQEVSLTQNIDNLKYPLQLNHSVNDTVVNIGYSRDLVEVLKTNDKVYEFHEYGGGGHNIDSPYFEQAINNTVNFYKKYL